MRKARARLDLLRRKLFRRLSEESSGGASSSPSYSQLSPGRWLRRALGLRQRVDLTSPGDLGAFFEDLALRRLRRQGLKLVARNYRCPVGELDLIMMDGDVLVFVEVRYRASDSFGGPLESVTAGKLTRIRRAMHRFQGDFPAYRLAATRIDIIAISGSREDLSRLDWRWVKGVEGSLQG